MSGAMGAAGARAARALAAALLVLVGCGAPTWSTSGGAGAGGSAGGELAGGAAKAAMPAPTHVLLTSDARLSATPGGPVVAWQRHFGAGPPGATAWRLVGREPGWLAVAPIRRADAPQPCTYGNGRLAALDITLWTPETSLRSTTGGVTRSTYADRSGVLLAPGVALRPLQRLGGGKELVAVEVDELRMNLVVRSQDLASGFVPAELPAPTAAVYVDHGAALRFGGTGTIGRAHRYHSLEGERLRSTADGELLRIDRRCATLYVFVEAAKVHDIKGSGGLGILGAMSDAKGPYVEAGTPLRWRDGSEAGVTAERVTLTAETLGPDDRTRCFRRGLHWGQPKVDAEADGALELCVDALAVRVPEGLGERSR